MKSYLIFIIQAFQSETPQGQLADSAVIELIDLSAEKALVRAEKLLKKKFYRVSSIIEKYHE